MVVGVLIKNKNEIISISIVVPSFFGDVGGGTDNDKEDCFWSSSVMHL